MKWLRHLAATLALGVLLAALAVGALWWDVQRFAHASLPLTETLCLQVERGATLNTLLNKLQAPLKLSYLDTLRWRALARLDGNASRMRAGEYALELGMTPTRLWQVLALGQSLQHRVTLIEGMTLEQVRDVLVQHPVLLADGFALSSKELMQAIGALGMPAEGAFLPETYVFTRGDSDMDVLRRAHEAMQQTLNQLWAQRDPGLPLQSPQEALILASIVEKETGVASERAKIAGLFMNRLRKGMKLQTDPTVIYGVGAAFDGNLRRRDLERDTPWNTYTRFGLPPTPIALPSKAALQAVMHPEATTALYFVADGRGGHVFSNSLDEHNRAVRRYISGKN